MTKSQRNASRIVARTRAFVDASAFCPRLGVQLDIALLGLLSKSIRFTQGACQLVSGGFHEEALALARSNLEVFLTARYITNKRSEHRAHSYLRFVSAHYVLANQAVAKFIKGPKRLKRTDKGRHLLEVGYRIKRGRRKMWTPIAIMAREPHRDLRDIKPDGTTFDVGFHYEAIYEFLSHYAHGTAVSLQTHALGRGGIFRVHAGEPKATRYGNLALQYAISYMFMTLILVSRHFDHPVPKSLDKALHSALSALRAELPQGFSVADTRRTH